MGGEKDKVTILSRSRRGGEILTLDNTNDVINNAKATDFTLSDGTTWSVDYKSKTWSRGK